MSTTNTTSTISTHVLDTATGKPVANLPIKLYRQQDNQWQCIASALSNEDGRVVNWLAPDVTLYLATYKIVFCLDDYYADQEQPAFYPHAEVCFRLQDERHHHIPLLLSPFGYSTYRGS